MIVRLVEREERINSMPNKLNEKEKKIVELNIKIATKELIKRVDAVIPETDLHSKIALRGKIIRLIAEESYSLIASERKDAVEGFIEQSLKSQQEQVLRSFASRNQIPPYRVDAFLKELEGKK